MSRSSWIVDALAGLVAVVAAIAGLALLRGVVSAAMALSPAETGSGGIGAVSAGIGEAALFSLLILGPSGLTNWLLASWARRTRGVAQTLHRAHLAALISWPVAIAVEIAMAALGFSPWWLIAMALLIGFLLASQFLLLSVLLATFVWQRRFAAAQGV